MNALRELGSVEEGDVMFFIADEESKAREIGGQVRDELGKRLNLIDPNVFKFCWIVDFPMFELSDEGELNFRIIHSRCRKAGCRHCSKKIHLMY